MEQKAFTACRLSSKKRADFISKARSRLLYCGPGMTDEELRAVNAVRDRLTDDAATILVDPTPDAFRAGFWGAAVGDLERLANKGREAPGLRLGLLVVDDVGYIYSPTAASVDSEHSESPEPNALRLSPGITQQLLDSLTARPGEPARARTVITAESVQETKKKLEHESSTKPHDQRALNYLRRRIRLVEIELAGYKLGNRRITLSAEITHALGSKDKTQINERLAAAWRPFAEGDDAELKRLQQGIEAARTDLRKKCLSNLGRYGQGLLDKQQQGFAEGCKELDKRVQSFIAKLREQAQQVVLHSQGLLAALLHERLLAEPALLPPDRGFQQRTDEQRRLEYTKYLVEQVHWPKAEEIVEGVKAKILWRDVSQEMLKDGEFAAVFEKAYGCKLQDVLKEADAQEEQKLSAEELKAAAASSGWIN